LMRWITRLPRDIRRFMSLFRSERADTVHVNGAFFVAPAVAAKLARIPLVWHLNDTVMPAKIAPFFGFAVHALADRVVVAAEAVAAHYGIDRSTYDVLYPPVNIRLYSADSPNSGEKDRPRRVGLVANWNPLKGVEYFVEAAALARARIDDDLEFVFAGARLKTHTDYSYYIDDRIRELGLDSACQEYGFVSDVVSFLRGLDILVLSSVAEASPMVVLEGMAAGVPIVATDVGGVRELLAEDPERPAGVVVPPRDPEAMAEAIVDLLRNPGVAERLGHNGRLLAEKRFSLDVCAQQHLKVYGGVMKRWANYVNVL
jgi:glycosyltransferase involved in cell wall biosynthesis